MSDADCNSTSAVNHAFTPDVKGGRVLPGSPASAVPEVDAVMPCMLTLCGLLPLLQVPDSEASS